MNSIEHEKDKMNGEGAPKPETPTSDTILGRCYEICIGGRLDPSWSDWFEGLELNPCGENWTMLCGRVADQSALLGILNKLCGLNLPLVSVNEVRDKGSPRSSQEGGE